MSASREVRDALQTNHFLQSLGGADRDLLLPSLSIVRCRAEEQLQGERNVGSHVYFPLTLVACTSFGHAEPGIGLIGREGVVGWSEVIEGDGSFDRTTVLLDGGTALVIPVEPFRRACRDSATMAFALLRCARLFTVQLGNTIRAAHGATICQRLSAWLLMLHDRIDGEELVVTHRALAEQLDVRRASVTDVLHVLEGELTLRCERGLIRMRDRRKLETIAGDAYPVTPLSRRSGNPRGAGYLPLAA